MRMIIRYKTIAKLVVLIFTNALIAIGCGGANGSSPSSSDGSTAETDGSGDQRDASSGTSEDSGSETGGVGPATGGSSGTIRDDSGNDSGNDGGSDDGSDGSAGSGASEAGGSSGTRDDAGTGGRPDIVPYEPECANLTPTQVIGNWDVVRHQTFTGTFQVGVVAFHEEGVDVVFSVNGTEVARVSNPTWNERTSVYEYWTALDANDYPDGPITVSAVIEPDCPGHESRTLEDLPLFANSGGSLSNDTIKWADCAAGNDNSGDGSESNPYATIEKALVEVGDGGTVYLKAGTCYELTSLYPSVDFEQWTTVQPEPGVRRQDVQILAASAVSNTSTGRFSQDMIRWKDVGIYSQTNDSFSTVLSFDTGHSAWFDGAEIYEQRGQWNNTNLWNSGDDFHVYLTDAHIHDLTNANFTFGRGVLITDVGSDIFRASSNIVSVNLTVRGIDPGDTAAHPDFFQKYDPGGTPENIVIYNTVVTNMEAQGIFGGEGDLSDVAFVNLVLEKDPADSDLTSQLTYGWNHMLLWHLTTVDSGFLLREPDNLDNIYIQNSSLFSLHHGSDTSLPGFTIDHNHFATLIWSQENGPMGTNATEGDPGYADVENDDYRPGSGSPLCGAGIPLPGVPADVEGEPYDSETPALGAYKCP